MANQEFPWPGNWLFSVQVFCFGKTGALRLIEYLNREDSCRYERANYGTSKLSGNRKRGNKRSPDRSWSMPRYPIRKCVTTGPKSSAEVGSCSRGTCNEPRFRISNRWMVIDRCLGRWASQITINLRMGCKTKKRLGVIEILPAIGLESRVRNGYRLTIKSNPNVSMLNIFLRKESFVQVELRAVL